MTEYRLVFTHKKTGEKVHVDLVQYVFSYHRIWRDIREVVASRIPFHAHYDDTRIVLV